ncbi:hypothetical protein QVD99_005861 [Batrachochytrium dendrobatidis]|nr:hypothetical protein QVD99_005861 [Batrachochytrium dendrobatidis]
MAQPWTCNVCTFINENPLYTACEMCDTVRSSTLIEPVAVFDSILTPKKRKPRIYDLTCQPLIDSNQVKRSRLHPCDDSTSSELHKFNSIKPVDLTLDLKDTSTLKPCFGGRIGMTFITGHNSQKRIRFQDLVDKATLKKACLSSFSIDDDWLCDVFPSTIKICLARPKPKMVPESVDKLPVTNNILWVFPKMSAGYGAMHIKFQLLWYPKFLRVVITSANLMPHDWQELENVVFYQDFPILNSRVRQSQHSETASSSTNEFSKTLYNLLVSMNIPQSVIASVQKHDFSKALGMLVVSLPGKHDATSMETRQFGSMGLCTASQVISRQFRFDLEQAIVCMQTASMGSTHPAWLRYMLSAFRGQDVIPETPSLASFFTQSMSSIEPITILFPSRRTVETSRNGIPGGGTIFFSSKFWSTFPRHIIRDGVSKTQGILMHSKINVVIGIGYIDLLATSQQLDIVSVPIHTQDNAHDHNTKLEKEIHGYIYCGSHNATQAAWGSVPVMRSSVSTSSQSCKSIQHGHLQVEIKNWELGILLPFRIRDACSHSSVGFNPDLSFVLPFEYPPAKYGPTDKPFSQY